MIQIEIVVLLGILGAAMGSFAGAMAWRLHTKRNIVNERSECESCHHKLGAWDLIPIISWLALGGHCRYCKVWISPLTLFAEAILAVLFMLSFVYWPFGFAAWQGVAIFVVWLSYLVILTILVIYDIRWMLLPDKLVYPLIGIACADAVLRVSLLPDASFSLYVLYVCGGLLALAGVYAALYVVSKGKWVGFGDVKLCIFIGIVLGWQKALLVLGLANMIGFLVIAPGLLLDKLTRKSRIPFGPFLIAGFVIAGLFGDTIIQWYLTFVGL